MSKSILITGGAGFVGSYLSNMFTQEGYSITAVDNLSNGKKENLVKDVKFLEIDITSDTFQNQLSQYNFDIVIHCAAQSSNARSFNNPKQDMLTNLYGTLNVLEYCKKHNIKRFIFTSSMSAYGEANDLPTKESYNCQPDSFYAVHKLGSEHYIRIYGQQYGLEYTIFRLYTTYGHGQNLDNRDQGLLSIYLSYIVKNDTLIVKGSKDRTRDIIHVSDVANAIKLSFDNPKSYGKIYNLGTGKKITIERMIHLLTVGLGYKTGGYPVKYESSTAGDPFDTLADINAVKSDLNWKPLISPEEGIKLTIKSYKNAKSKKEKVAK